MAQTSITLDTHEVRAALETLERRGGDVRVVWRRFLQYMRVQTALTFQALRTGGVYRGVRWSYFAPQYTRKTDGVVVPAWGGVPKIRGTGLVLGRLRPSRTRVRQGDAILDDTSTLKGRATTYVPVLNKHELRFGTNLGYARFQARRRPFLFFDVPRDKNVLLGMLRDHVFGGQR